MNTNGNVYTIVYTTIIVVVVAAVLALAAQGLKSRQDANIKAETISQMLTAAQFATKDELSKMSNDAVLDIYADKISQAFTVNAKGEKVADLSTERANLELMDALKGQNTAMKKGGDLTLPVYIFDKEGTPVTVVPVYGAGLWGPVWGYVALDKDLKTVVGAYFDHESETPGLGAKITDDPAFRAQFVGKKVDFAGEAPLSIVKGGAQGESQIDAITGATMTSKGLSAAIVTWLKAYIPYLQKVAPEGGMDCCKEGESCEGMDEGCGMDCCKDNNETTN